MQDAWEDDWENSWEIGITPDFELKRTQMINRIKGKLSDSIQNLRNQGVSNEDIVFVSRNGGNGPSKTLGFYSFRLNDVIRRIDGLEECLVIHPENNYETLDCFAFDSKDIDGLYQSLEGAFDSREDFENLLKEERMKHTQKYE